MKVLIALLIGSLLLTSNVSAFSYNVEAVANVDLGPKTTTTVRRTYNLSATWYCDSSRNSQCTVHYPEYGKFAAISPELLRWRNHYALVCYQKNCVTVKIIDCNCQAYRAIDLYAFAFRKITWQDRGRMTVSVTFK